MSQSPKKRKALPRQMAAARSHYTGERILRLNEVIAASGKSRAEIYEDMAHGLFPQNFSLSEGGQSVGWLESEIIEWRKQRIEARDKAKAG